MQLQFTRGRRTRRFYRWGGVALTIVAAAYFLGYVAENWSRLPSLLWNGRGVALVAAAFGLYGVMLLLFPIAWLLLLRAVGETPRVLEVLAISLVSQFAKYAPGNIAHHIGRVALASAYGLDAPRVIFTMTVETGWVIFTAATITVVTLFVGAPAVLENEPQAPAIWQFALAGIVAALAPLAGVQVLNQWRAGPLRRLLGSESIKLPRTHVLLGCFTIYVGHYLLMGAILYLLAGQVFGQANAEFWLLTGIFAVAWLAGFVMPGAPGGLGVREAILVTALGPLYGEGTAVAITVTLRIITTAGDGLGFLAGLGVQHQLRKAGIVAAGRPRGSIPDD